MTPGEQKIETFKNIAKFLSEEIINPKDFVSTIDFLMKYIKNGQEITAKNLNTLARTIERLEKYLNSSNEELKLFQPQLDALKKQIAGLKLQKGDKGDKGDRGEDAAPEYVAKVLKNDQTFINSIKGEDGDIKDLSPEEIRNSLELLTGDERLDKSAIRGLEELTRKVQNQGPVGGQSGLRVYVGGAKKGLLKAVNFVAGANVTLTYSTVNGLDTITFASTVGSASFIDNEVVSFSGTTGTLANTPIAGSVKFIRGGVRQQAGAGNDYTISGATITLAVTASSGEVFLADYRI